MHQLYNDGKINTKQSYQNNEFFVDTFLLIKIYLDQNKKCQKLKKETEKGVICAVFVFRKLNGKTEKKMSKPKYTGTIQCKKVKYE